MKLILAALDGAGVAVVLTIGSIETAEARHKCGHKGRKCAAVTTSIVKCQKSTVSATATGVGAFGVGTKRAQVNARNYWETLASAKYGSAYGNWWRALGASFDCRRTLAKATCTAIARPCKA